MLTEGYKKITDHRTADLHMRDPFVFTDTAAGRYLLFGTTLADGAGNREPVFEVYQSEDLANWRGPYIAFDPPKGFYGVKNFWAPEVHAYRGACYMFASVKGGIGSNRGTCVLRADAPEGPYLPHSEGNVTLAGNECLDGTLYVDGDGQPWVVFCHEWTQIYYGKILARRLSLDLKRALDDEVITIVDTQRDIQGGQLPWIRKMYDPRIEQDGYLTDAPFLQRHANGSLRMLWSSYSSEEKGYGGGYTVAVCRSQSGEIQGPWEHENELLLDKNMGHASIFHTLDGRQMLCVHAPDTPHGSERPLFLDLE